MANINDFQEQLDILEETKSQIKSAIIDKGQMVEDSDSFRSYAEKIDSILTREETENKPLWYLEINAGITESLERMLEKMIELTFIYHSAYKSEKRLDTFDIEAETMRVGDYAIIKGINLYTDIERTYMGFCRITNINEEGGTAKLVMLEGWEVSQFNDKLQITSDKIKYGSNIMGVTGNYTGDGTLISANQLDEGVIAYSQSQRVVGTLKKLDLNATQSNPIKSTINVENPYDRKYIEYDANEDTLNITGTVVGGFDGHLRAGAFVKSSAGPKSLNSLKKDQNIKPENIKSGVNILGVEGTLESGADTSDATATASDIAEGVTAYIADGKVGGTMPILGGIVLLETEKLSFGDKIHNKDGSTITIGEPSIIITNNSKSRCIIPNTDDNDYFTVVKGSIIGELSGLAPSMLKKGVEILGVTGEYEGIDTSDANATSNVLMPGYSAYVNGEKIYGSMIEVPYQQHYTEEERQSGKVDISVTNDYSFQDCEVIVTNTFGETSGQKGYINNIWEQKWIPASMLADAIGLTPDKIKKGEKILGMEGTYEAEVEVEVGGIVYNQEEIIQAIEENHQAEVVSDDILGNVNE